MFNTVSLTKGGGKITKKSQTEKAVHTKHPASSFLIHSNSNIVNYPPDLNTKVLQVMIIIHNIILFK